MSYINTEAIVLAKVTLREADRLYILYTPEHGKIEARVKSAASASSKLAGSLEPLSFVKVMIARGPRWETIAGVQLLKRFNCADLSVFGQSGLVREIFLKMVKEGVREPLLFSQLYDYLLALEKQQANGATCRFLTMRFIWQFLNLAGFSHQQDNLDFLPVAKYDRSDSALTELLKNCLTDLPRPLQVSHNLLQKLEGLTYNYLRHILERDLRSLSFAINF
ncbi:MAG: DNA repair protein RecO [Candidatus Komeilibacteria bacterium]|nr:DNA repair protein RecO [Candidatus Komeilibacteria bacterium]